MMFLDILNIDFLDTCDHDHDKFRYECHYIVCDDEGDMSVFQALTFIHLGKYVLYRDVK